MGNVIGIVAEYNPFHNGHARLIEQTRARLGADCPVVCVMSGDFVQRGSPAALSTVSPSCTPTFGDRLQ